MIDLEKLNNEQKEAVLYNDGPLLLISGAGTGKTFTVVKKVEYLISEMNVDPENILMLTFTNKAADEMRRRAEETVETNGMFAGTFHSFCNYTLRKYAYKIGYTPGFIVLTPDDELDILRFVMADIEHPKELIASDLRSVFSNMVNLNQTLEQACHGKKRIEYRMLPCIEKILEAYTKYKKDEDRMSFDDLLVNMIKLLEEHESVRRELDAKYKYIICDEYQDTNTIQEKILTLLSRDVDYVTAIGDPNQSIYKFRGAKIHNILSFDKRHSGCKKIVLFQNYRSPQEVLDVANAVMENVTEGEPVSLKGQFVSNRKPDFVWADKRKDMEEFCAEYIQSLLKKKEDPKQITVLIRSGNDSNWLENELTKRGIAFDKYGGIKFFNRKEVKDIFAYLTLTVNDKSVLSWYQAFLTQPGIGEVRAKSLAEMAAEYGKLSLIGEKKNFSEIVSLIGIIDTAKALPLKERIAAICDYYENLIEGQIKKRKASGTEAEEKKITDLDKLEEHMNEARALIDFSETYTSAEALISDVYLDSAKQKENPYAINIMTVHSAKGLEFDHVILLMADDGVFPSTGDNNLPGYKYRGNGFDVSELFSNNWRHKCGWYKTEEDAEERRIFYVAITRAKKRLVLMGCATGVDRGKTWNFNPPHYLMENEWKGMSRLDLSYIA